MGHLNDRHTLLIIQTKENLHDLLPLIRVEIAGRLVGQDQGRSGDQGAGHADQLLLAPGALRWTALEGIDAADVAKLDHHSVYRTGRAILHRIPFLLFCITLRFYISQHGF